MELIGEGCVFRFSSPEILQKLTVTYDGTDFTAVYDGIETQVSGIFLQEVFPLYEAVHAFLTGNAEQIGENIRKIALDGNEFLLYYESEGGVITRLDAKGADSLYSFEILSCIERNDDTESARADQSK